MVTCNLRASISSCETIPSWLDLNGLLEGTPTLEGVVLAFITRHIHMRLMRCRRMKLGHWSRTVGGTAGTVGETISHFFQATHALSLNLPSSRSLWVHLRINEPASDSIPRRACGNCGIGKPLCSYHISIFIGSPTFGDLRSVVHFRDSVGFTNSEHEVRSSYLLR